MPPLVAGRIPLFLYTAAALLSSIGLADAIYLTVEHLTGHSLECVAAADCSKVLSSFYANVGPVPIAAFGALAYFATFSLATLAAFGYRLAAIFLKLIIPAMFGTTLWLLFVQAFVLHAFCAYCLLSAAVTLLLTGLLAALLVRTEA